MARMLEESMQQGLWAKHKEMELLAAKVCAGGCGEIETGETQRQL